MELQHEESLQISGIHFVDLRDSDLSTRKFLGLGFPANDSRESISSSFIIRQRRNENVFFDSGFHCGVVC